MKKQLMASVMSVALLVGGLTGYSLPASAEVSPEDGKFTIAVIPDTQQEVLTGTPPVQNQFFKNRNEWLVAHKDELDLRFVAHTGDVINGDTANGDYIKVASDAMKILDDAHIPNALAIGGIDTAAVKAGGSAADPAHTSTLVRDTSHFNSYFSTVRYPGIVTFEENKIDNSYQTFTAEGKKWLVLTLEVWPRTEAVQWAKGVVESHQDYNIIVNTHEFLEGNNTISTSSGYGSNSPKYLFDNLIKLYPNIKVVLSGNRGGEAGTLVTVGVNGNTIVAIRGCFQSSINNPVQLLEIDAKAGTASCRFYAPYDQKEWPQLAQTFTGLNFVSPAGAPATAETVEDLIQQLPAVITLADKADVQAARAAYTSLSDDQKQLVANLDRLVTAEAEIERLAAEGKFSIAIIPDTQQEVVMTSLIEGEYFKNRMKWLTDNREVLDLRFVLHTGDVVNWDTPTHDQYQIASDAMKVLDDAGIPSLLTIGNHDTAAVGPGGSAADPANTRTLVRDTTTFNTYFPISRYPGIVTFEPNKVDNAYRTFAAAGKKWLVMTLELWPRTEAINWAKTVVASHPDYNVLIETHSYLDGQANIYQGSDYGANSPQYLYDNLIKLYPNIKLVFSGHTGIAGSRTDTGVNGNKIVTVLGCFHSNVNNPVQLMEIDVNEDTVSNRFFAPSDGKEWTEYNRTFSGLEFVSPATNYTALNVAIADAQRIAGQTGIYSAGSLADYGKAIAAAQAAAANLLLSQSEIDAAVETLNNARNLLVDISNLRTAVNKAETIDVTKFTADTAEAFSAVLTAAQQVLAGKPTQDEVNEAFDQLFTARNDLVYSVDKDILRLSIEIAQNTDTTGCTSGSIAALNEALEAAQNVLNQADATQEEVNDAAKALLNAVINLKDIMADKAELQKLADLAAELTEAKYTPASWSPVKAALEAAQALLPDDNATQEAVDGAYGTLAQAIAHLTLRAQTNSLNVAIELAQTIVSQLDQYAPATVEGLQEKLDAAKAVQGNLNATQEEVDAAAKALAEAAAKARLKANKKDLQQAYAQAQKLDAGEYTENSVKRLNRVLTATETVLKDENATQQEVDKAKDVLSDAVQTLEVKPTSGTENSSSPSSNSSSSSSSSGNGSSSSENGTGAISTVLVGTSTEDGVESPKTGEPFPVVIPIVFVAALAGIAFLLAFKKKIVRQ